MSVNMINLYTWISAFLYVPINLGVQIPQGDQGYRQFMTNTV